MNYKQNTLLQQGNGSKGHIIIIFLYYENERAFYFLNKKILHLKKEYFDSISMIVLHEI
jgi:hypothetical protein